MTSQNNELIKNSKTIENHNNSTDSPKQSVGENININHPKKRHRRKSSSSRKYKMVKEIPRFTLTRKSPDENISKQDTTKPSIESHHNLKNNSSYNNHKKN